MDGDGGVTAGGLHNHHHRTVSGGLSVGGSSVSISAPGAQSTVHQSLAVRLDHPVTSLSISPGGRDVVLAAKRGLYIVNLERPFESPRILQHLTKWDVADVQWNPHPSRSNWVATTSNQKALIWNISRMTAPQNGITASSTQSSGQNYVEYMLSKHLRAVSDINWSPFHPESIATCSYDSYIHLWDLRMSHSKPSASFSSWTVGATQVKYNRINEWILASSHDTDVRIWDLRKGSSPVTLITAHMTKIYGIDWSRRDENEIITCSQDKLVKFWNILQPRTCQSIITTAAPVWRARFTPFGTAVVTMPQRKDNNLNLWSCESKAAPLYTFSGHMDLPVEFVWRRQGGHYQLVTWSKDHTMRLWPVSSDLLKAAGHQDDAVPGNVVPLDDERQSVPPLSPDTTLLVPQQSSAYVKSPSAFDQVVPGQSQDESGSINSRYRTNGGGRQVDPIHSQRALNPARVGESAKSYMNSNSSDTGSLSKKVENGRLNSNASREMQSQTKYQLQQPEDIAKERTDQETEARASLKSLEDEISTIVRSLPSVKIDTNLERRACCISLQCALEPLAAPGALVPSVFVRVNVWFPESYPCGVAPMFQIQKTGVMSMAHRTLLTTKLNQIGTAFAERSLPCLDACVRYLLGDPNAAVSIPVQRVGKEDLSDTAMNSSSASASASNHSDHDHDWDKQRQRNYAQVPDGSFTADVRPTSDDDLSDTSSSEADGIMPAASRHPRTMRDNRMVRDAPAAGRDSSNVPFPRLCGASFSVSGKLIYFLSPLPHPSTSKFTAYTLSTRNQQPVLQSQHFQTQPKTYPLYESYRAFVLARTTQIMVESAGPDQVAGAGVDGTDYLMLNGGAASPNDAPGAKSPDDIPRTRTSGRKTSSRVKMDFWLDDDLSADEEAAPNLRWRPRPLSTFQPAPFSSQDFLAQLLRHAPPNQVSPSLQQHHQSPALILPATTGASLVPPVRPHRSLSASGFTLSHESSKSHEQTSPKPLQGDATMDPANLSKQAPASTTNKPDANPRHKRDDDILLDVSDSSQSSSDLSDLDAFDADSALNFAAQRYGTTWLQDQPQRQHAHMNNDVKLNPTLQNHLSPMSVSSSPIAIRLSANASSPSASDGVAHRHGTRQKRRNKHQHIIPNQHHRWQKNRAGVKSSHQGNSVVSTSSHRTSKTVAQRSRSMSESTGLMPNIQSIRSATHLDERFIGSDSSDTGSAYNGFSPMAIDRNIGIRPTMSVPYISMAKRHSSHHQRHVWLDAASTVADQQGVSSMVAGLPGSTSRSRYGTIVCVSDLSMFLPAQSRIAAKYIICHENPAHICKVNRQHAVDSQRMDHARIWTLAELIISRASPSSLEVKSKTDDYTESDTFLAMMWYNRHPFGHDLTRELFDHLEKSGDIQMLAMLVCVLDGPRRQMKAVGASAAHTSASMNGMIVPRNSNPSGTETALYLRQHNRGQTFLSGVGNVARPLIARAAFSGSDLATLAAQSRQAVLEMFSSSSGSTDRAIQKVVFASGSSDPVGPLGLFAAGLPPVPMRLSTPVAITGSALTETLYPLRKSPGVITLGSHDTQYPNLPVVSSNLNMSFGAPLRGFSATDASQVAENMYTFGGQMAGTVSKSVGIPMRRREAGGRLARAGSTNSGSGSQLTRLSMGSLVSGSYATLSMTTAGAGQGPSISGISGVNVSNSVSSNSIYASMNAAPIISSPIDRISPSLSSLPWHAPGADRRAIKDRFIEKRQPQLLLDLGTSHNVDSRLQHLPTVPNATWKTTTTTTNAHNNISYSEVCSRDNDYGDDDATLVGIDEQSWPLDPKNWHVFNAYLWQYGELLYAWGMLEQRAELLKYMESSQPQSVLPTATRAGLRLQCERCGGDLDPHIHGTDSRVSSTTGYACSVCSTSSTSFDCAICRVPARRLVIFCQVCRHGGHAAHMREWLSVYNECPTGCGCQCREMFVHD